MGKNKKENVEAPVQTVTELPKIFKKPANLGDIMVLLGEAVAWGVMIAFFVVMPLYTVDGYSSIASNKYLYFMQACKITAIVAGVALLIRLCLWGFTREEIFAYKKVMWLDIFMAAFGLLSLLSHLTSDFRTNTMETYYLNDWFYEGSLYGTRGWFMGLLTYLCFLMLYFILSRCLIYNKIAYIPAVATVVFICQWGVLNRYGIGIFGIEAEDTFLATIGNINWFCGFTSVLVPLLWGLYMGCNRKAFRYIYMAGMLITFEMIVLNSSDSGYFSLLVTMAVLFAYSMVSKERMQRFLEIVMTFLAACASVKVTDLLGGRTEEAGHMEFFLGLPALIALVVVAVIYVLITLKVKEWHVTTMKKVRKIYGIVLGALVLIFVLLIIINTKTDGALPLIGGSSIFLFNSEWGSLRGATWSLGVKTFLHLDFWHKLVGSGPDTFFYEMITFDDLTTEWSDCFGNARLTNAHNEIITLLVNIGILGTAAFIGILVTAVKSSFSAAKEHPEYVGFGLCVISYIANDMFSFEQITNTPFLFLVLGLEGAALVVYDKAGARLTKKDNKHTIQKGKKSRK